jgi:hypothetical protein
MVAVATWIWNASSDVRCAAGAAWYVHQLDWINAGNSSNKELVGFSRFRLSRQVVMVFLLFEFEDVLGEGWLNTMSKGPNK